MTTTAQPEPEKRSTLRTIVVVLLLVLLFPLLLLAGLAVMVWTSPAWLPQAGAALAERYGYQLTLEDLDLADVDLLRDGGLLRAGISLGRFKLSNTNGLFRLEAQNLRFDWSLEYEADGFAALSIGSLDVSVDPSDPNNDARPTPLKEGESSRPPGEQLANLQRQLSQPLRGFGSQLPSVVAAYIPRMPVDFHITIDDFRLAASDQQYEQDIAWQGRIEFRLADQGRPDAELAISSAGQLTLPDALRTLAIADSPDQPAFSASLAAVEPLVLNAAVRSNDASARLDSEYGTMDLKLLASERLDGSRWDLNTAVNLDTATLQPRFRLPAQPPLTSTAIPLTLMRGKLNLDAALRLDEHLLPLSQQPVDAHLMADLDLEAAGGPGTLFFRHGITITRHADDFRLELAPIALKLQPVGVWWKTNSWFAESGLQQVVLQPWTLRSKPLTCVAQATMINELVETVSAGAAGLSLQKQLALRKLLASCGWPLDLRLNAVGAAGENALSISLLPDFTTDSPLPNSLALESGVIQALMPGALDVKLNGAGMKLHSQLPAQWSVGSSVSLRSQKKREGFDILLRDTSLNVQLLERPEIRVDSLAAQSQKLQFTLSASGSQQAGSSTYTLQSGKGDVKAEIIAQGRPPFSNPPFSKPLTARLDTNFDLTRSKNGRLPDIALDLHSLSTAGLDLQADLAVERQMTALSGDFRLSGTPDSQLMGPLREMLAQSLPQLPDLRVEAGEVLYVGRLGLNTEVQPLRWSTSGIVGLQRWTITNEQAEASRVTLSAKIEADQTGLKILSEGESFSTVSADLSFGQLPFPGAFIKLAADLSFPETSKAGGAIKPLSGTINLQQAHISAFNGDIELTGNTVIELPLTRMEKNPARIAVGLRSIDLGTLVALESEHVEATGTVSGRIGLVYTGKSVRIPASEPGKLSADGSGWIRLKEAGQWQAMAGGNPQLLFAVGALGNFHYDSLKSTVVFDNDEWLNLALELQGRNPEVRDGRSIHYNLNVQSNILSLLRSLAVTENLSRSLEERVLKAYE